MFDPRKTTIRRVCRTFCIMALGLIMSASVLADEITLNLKDADIRALISTVSKFTGKNFIIDPRIKAKVTVISSKTMTEEEVYEVFLSVLQVHGFAAVPTGNIIKIVPVVNAKQAPIPMNARQGLNSDGDELITRIIRLDYVPASQLVPILRPLVPQHGHLAAYNPTNSLIITDHAGNIKRLQAIIAGVDKPENDELEVIPLAHASAPEIVRIVNSLYPQNAKDPANSIVLAADERTNSILMTGDRTIRIKIRTTIMQLDTPMEDGGNTHVIYLKYAKAENLVPILSGIDVSGGATTGSTANNAVPHAAAKLAARRNNANQATEAIILADEETNALIITADPNTIRSLKAVIRQLDIRRAQVLIEAIVAEISSTNDREFGTSFAVDGTESTNTNVPLSVSNFSNPNIGQILTDLGASSVTGTAASVTSPGILLGGGGTSNSGTRYALLLQALATDSATNILSTPSIVTLDNEEAEIIVGQNVPFVTGSTTSATNTNPFTTVDRQDVGLSLKVTPQINDGDTIRLDLEQEASSVLLQSDVLGPTTRKRSIKTSVLVEDGGLLILGGLMEESINDVTSKVPLLGDIPLIGRLFSSNKTEKEKQNLMVFLRPSILRDEADASFISQEKYNLLRSLQMQANDDDLEEPEPVLPKYPPKKVKEAESKASDEDDIWTDEDDNYL